MFLAFTELIGIVLRLDYESDFEIIDISAVASFPTTQHRENGYYGDERHLVDRPTRFEGDVWDIISILSGSLLHDHSWQILGTLNTLAHPSGFLSAKLLSIEHRQLAFSNAECTTRKPSVVYLDSAATSRSLRSKQGRLKSRLYRWS
jgi:hypothetical protein